MSNLSYPSIPDPGQSQESLFQSVMALKQTVELLTGQRPGPTFGAPRLFIQSVIPVTSDTGDFWVNSSTNKLSYWNGKAWILITS